MMYSIIQVLCHYACVKSTFNSVCDIMNNNAVAKTRSFELEANVLVGTVNSNAVGENY